MIGRGDKRWVEKWRGHVDRCDWKEETLSLSRPVSEQAFDQCQVAVVLVCCDFTSMTMFFFAEHWKYVQLVGM